eukprot:Lankesteria_metandrocarpae@DN2436_c0_g1_i1.p1
MPKSIIPERCGNLQFLFASPSQKNMVVAYENSGASPNTVVVHPAEHEGGSSSSNVNEQLTQVQSEPKRKGRTRMSVDCPTGVVNFEALLVECYEEMVEEDPETRTEALAAYDEMKDRPLDSRDHEPVKKRDNAEVLGVVARRGPVNPFGKKKTSNAAKQDPALEGNSLVGRLVVTLNTSTVLFMVFSQSLILNFTQYGSYYVSRQVNKMIGPSPEVLNALGGLNANAIRAGENVRLWWAMWMHSGWIHIGVNVLSQLQFLYIMEPDWGFIRSILTYWISGVTGMLFSAILDPCSVTVGSSGALYGLMAGLIVYVVEFYDSIPNPLFLLIFTIVIVVISLLSSLAGSVDLWAHLFGCIGGFMIAVGTARTLLPLLKCMGYKEENEDTRKPNKSIHLLRRCFPNHDWSMLQTSIRALAVLIVVILWVVGFVYLYSSYEFQPFGQVHFSGVRRCCCCYSTDVLIRANWFCAYCDLAFGDTTWGDHCATMHT